MGNNRKNAKRGSEPKINNVTSIVQGIAYAMELNMLHLPKCMYHYRQAVYRAFDGDLEPLEHAVKHVGDLLGKERFKVDNNPELMKWAVGMQNHQTAIYYVLRMFLQLFQCYRKENHGSFESLSSVNVGKECRILGKTSCPPKQANIINI